MARRQQLAVLSRQRPRLRRRDRLFWVWLSSWFSDWRCWLAGDRRRPIVRVSVTDHPTAAFVSQQLREAFPFATAPRLLIQDRDAIYGAEVRSAIKNLDREEAVTAPRSPWQSPFVERLIGTLRRECLDHVVVLDEAHLKRILSRFLDYYHTSRCHMALGDNAPIPRAVQPPALGPVRAVPMVGGLHHHYRRVA